MNPCAKQFMVCAFLFAFCFLATAPAHAQWVAAYGGTGDDRAYSIQQTQGGGYIIAGETSSFGAGGYDAWILKLTDAGVVSWQTTYGGSSYDTARSVQQTTDGGYIVAGYTQSYGAGDYDAWILKLTSAGVITWQRTYGGTSYDVAQSIRQTSDGGYILAGYTYSSGNGQADYWILKLTSTGAISWEKTYGGPDIDAAYGIQQTTDGGYIVVGESGSLYTFEFHTWIVKLTNTGDVSWQKAYAGGSDAGSIQQTTDGGYIVDGHTFSSGDSDAWILKLTSAGDISWQRTYGGRGDGIDPLSGYDSVTSIQQTADGGYIVAGRTNSYGAGDHDAWILKLASTGVVSWEKTYGGPGLDRARSIQQTPDGGYIVAGETSSFGAGGSDVWIIKLDGSGNVESCGLEGISTAIVSDTTTTPNETTVTPANSAATHSNSSATVTNTTVSQNIICMAPPHTNFPIVDFDGDRKTDITVWRPGDGYWYTISSKDGSVLSWQWGSGALNDVPVAGDYDGDGKTDCAVWRPGDGYWYVLKSSGGVDTVQWGSGTLNDVPVPGDYDGDGKTDVAVWRPGDGYWYIISSKDDSIITQQWGAGYDPYNDKPVPGDYDGDGKTDYAVWRPGDGFWYIVNSKDGSIKSQQWGSSALNDVLVPGDYDGDGKTDIAVWRPGEGYWYIIRSKDGSILSQQWGAGYAPYNDVPVPGDYDGDGKTDLAVWRLMDGFWYILKSSDGGVIQTQWGWGLDPINDEPISQKLNW